MLLFTPHVVLQRMEDKRYMFVFCPRLTCPSSAASHVDDIELETCVSIALPMDPLPPVSWACLCSMMAWE
jgi:hypothetical protein